MPLFLRPIGLLGSLASALLVLSACDSDSSSRSSRTPETVQTTPSIPGTVKATGGGRTELSIPFNASGSAPLSDLTITSGLASLPSGWTGPATFGCATVTTGTGCLLNLTFAPTGAVSGSLTLAYSYADSKGVSRSGSLSIPYQSTASDNVVATPSVSGQVNALVSTGSQSVAVTFDTDDGNPASSLALTTSLTSLPEGWSSTANGFTCASVSTGNGCQLPLTFQPTALGGGTLTLAFTYLDNSGTAKTGSLSIPYSATTNDSVVASAFPSGQIVAVAPSGTQTVAVTFTTDDGNSATGLSVTSPSLDSLPAGWSTPGTTFSCDSVTTGNGCQLNLTYAPGAVESGTLQLAYGYTNNSGTAKTGTVSIPYAATSHDHVAGTLSPTGQITALSSSGSQAVQVTFNTDDGHTATGLTLTSALSALPTGWSSTGSTFTCAAVSAGNGCQLPLVFAPTSVGSGTLSLGYGYTDNAGTPQTGTVTINYAGVTHNTVTSTVSQSGTINVSAYGSQPVSVTFTSDDGNPLTGFSVTAGLGSLPTDWSSAAQAFSCATVSTGSSCKLDLTFAPQSAESGTVTLNYAYTDNAGTAQTGSLNVNYASQQQYVYIVDYQNGVYECAIGSGGTLGTCSVTAGNSMLGIGFAGSYAYLTNYGSDTTIQLCDVNSNGTLSGCRSSGGNGFNMATQYAVQGSTLYASDANGSSAVTMCTIASDGTLSACSNTGPASWANGFALGDGVAYVSGTMTGLQICSLNVAGALTNCLSSSALGSRNIVLAGGYAYLPNGNDPTVNVCQVGSGGALSNCAASTVISAAGTYLARSVAVVGSTAYVSMEFGYGGSFQVYACAISSTDGSLSNCQASNGGVGSFPNIWGVVVH